jgi:LPS-assembly lipoprotein
MLLFDTSVKSLRLLAFSALALGLGFVSGCQVRPLYATSTPTAEKLASIEISDADDRVEQEVRNSLIFLTSGGAGEPTNAQYRLALNVTSQVKGVLYDQASDTAGAGRILVQADFNLSRADTGETVKSGNRSAVALVDFPVQEFAKLRAIRDGENRAARELAEIIRADIAAALGR